MQYILSIIISFIVCLFYAYNAVQSDFTSDAQKAQVTVVSDSSKGANCL